MTAEITVTGAVQGIGYRPYVAELATEYGLQGNVRNSGGIVRILVRGEESVIHLFVDHLKNHFPAGAIIISVTCKTCRDDRIKSDAFASGFIIIESEQGALSKELPVFPPDIGICDNCMEEMRSAADRRYHYPLISCASCGPRFSILKKLPYDRPVTTMDRFPMCPECQTEYGRGRRRHAQTISCHDCGPQMIFDRLQDGKIVRTEKDEAMHQAADILSLGGIIGMKGIGGYQLLTTAFADASVLRLRSIKGREKKPFAIMFTEMKELKKWCVVNEKEEVLLQSPARPIVLLEKRDHIKWKPFSNETSKESRYIGAFLPATGAHRLLLEQTEPLIVTSANLSGEPMITDDQMFRDQYLQDVDGMLYHEREILRPLDDSVAYCLSQADGTISEHLIRRARGYVPLPVFLKNEEGSGQHTIMAFGGDLKGAFAFYKGKRVILSQYLGDLANAAVQQNFERESTRMEEIFQAHPDRIVCDMHPGYFSTAMAFRYAAMLKVDQPIQVQHHHAHIASVMAEHGLQNCIGVAYDGTGYGTDGKLWGGEFLYCRDDHMQRMGHLSNVLLCGGDRVSTDAALAAACYLASDSVKMDAYEPDRTRKQMIHAALANHINTIDSSSMGRLFDAAACIMGIRGKNSYEGECAIALENAAAEYMDMHPGVLEKRMEDDTALHIPVQEDSAGNLLADQKAFVNQIAEDMLRTGELSLEEQERFRQAEALQFHAAVIRMTVEICEKIRSKTGENTVALSGGVFANRILLRGCIGYLRKSGFMIYWNKTVPANDGGISLGQAFLAGMRK